ncbi:hypothetical protein BKA64DRAFT_354531 [Cadophora sp. MPI-SDFR-AT-0126]|nr:hypothetical protein BKA64DRAFT_354531 [Leotiomycetes sp. MPI-SDFR-AT-0126]
MAQTMARQTAMDDEDDISLTSTESEDYGSDAEFTVDRILAEKGPAKNKYYLISWEGYPEEKSTWEPQVNVGSDTLEEWAGRLAREKQGIDEPFDVEKFEATIKRLEGEKVDRHKRREAKRRRIKTAKLGAMAAKRIQQTVRTDSDSSSEAVEENEVENVPGIKIKGTAKRRQLGTKQQFKRPIKDVPTKSTQTQSDSSSEEVPLAQQKGITRSEPTNGPTVQQSKQADVLGKATKPALSASKGSKGVVPPLAARGRKGATRGGSNVFQSRDQTKGERSLLKSASDPSKKSKTFNNMRQRWLAEKQGRNLADRAPDPEQTGGLFDPSKPIQPINPSALRKSTKIRDDSEQPTSELFVPAHSPVTQLPEAVPAPTYQYSQPKPSRQVCFFWHRNQENSLEPGCANKYDCTRYHHYEPGADISPAPPNYVWLESRSAYSGPDVCWFWHRKQLDSNNPACSNGDSCPRLHEYREGAQVIPPPGFVFPPGEMPPQTSEQIQDDSPIVIDDDFSHHDKPDVLPPWEEPVASSIRSAPSTSLSNDTDVAPPSQQSAELHKPDVLPPWKKPAAVRAEKRPSRSTCFFWDLAQNGTRHFCKHGNSCTYVHAYEPGIPVAPPPEGWVGQLHPSHSDVDHDNTDRPQVRLQLESTSGPETGSMDGIPPPSSMNSSRIAQISDPSERPPWDPYDPSYAICHFWNERGTCTKGNNCNFFHNSDEHIPVAPSIQEQQRIKSQTTCRDWENGKCSKGDCWYMHKPRVSAPTTERPEHVTSRKVTFDETTRFTDEPEAMPSSGGFGERYFRGLQPTDLLGSLIQPSQRKTSSSGTPAKGISSFRKSDPEVESLSTRPSGQPPKRKAWSPRDATNAICHFWHKGKCKKPDCEYIHSTDPTLPIAPHPYDLTPRTTCPLWAEGRCPVPDDECPYLHETTNFIPSLRRGLGSGSYDGSHNTYRPEEPAVPQTTPSGPRTKSVRFADGPSPAEPNHNARANSTSSRNTSSFGRADESRTACRFFKTGYCRRGTSCHFLHEDPSRRSPSYHDMDHEMLDTPHDSSTGSDPTPLPFNRMARDDRPQNDEVASHVDADIDMLRSEVTQLDVGQSASNPSQSTGPAKRNKVVSMDDYKKQKAMAKAGERAKKLVFGYDAIHSAFFDFGEVEPGQEFWKQEFLSTAQFAFNRFCMAQDLKSQQGLLHRRSLKHGCLQPADSDNPAMLKFVNHVADELILRIGGLLTTCESFAILLYPTKREEWSFLEQSASEESRLRYLIFKHDFHPEVGGSQHVPAKLEFGEPYRTLLADKIQGMRLKNLLPVFPKDKNPYKFFLMFPGSEKLMAQYFSAWILASHPESQIFDSLSEGSWDFYVKNMDGYGVILIHESIASSLHQLPFLSRILKHAGIVIWNVSDSVSLYPLFPSTLLAPDPHVGRLRFTRLFPHGCAFLLTPSFIVAEPERSHEILNWFLNKKFVNTTAGTWKLVCCHDFRGYILDLANSKAREKEEFEQEHKDKPAKDSMLYQKKLDFRHCEIRYKIYKLLLTWQLKNARDDSDSDSDCNNNNENPLVQAPKSIDQDDEEGLINWFAGWAMLKLDTYRKFPVIGTNSVNVAWATRIKEVKVPKRGATTRTTTITEADTVPSPASLQKQKALEIANRLSAAGPKQVSSAAGDLDTKANDSDVSMDLAESSPVSSRGNHNTDARQPSEVSAVIAQTGCSTEEANRLLNKANGDLGRAIDLHNEADFDGSFIELLRTDGVGAGGGRPPSLAVGESADQRAFGLHVSPAVQPRRPSEQPIPDGISSPHIEGPANGSTSTAGAATAEYGSSVRPNNAVHRNTRVVDGIPQLEVGSGSKESSRDVSRRASLVMSPSEMSLSSTNNESDNGGERPFKNGRFAPIQEPQPQPQDQAQLRLHSDTNTSTDSDTEPEIETETISIKKTFKATSAWYRELQAKDMGWEHVSVLTQWEEVKNYFGIK